MLMTTFSETRAFTSMFQVEKGTWVPKWSEKLALKVLKFKKPFVVTSSEACALTPRKCFAEEDLKMIRKI